MLKDMDVFKIKMKAIDFNIIKVSEFDIKISFIMG